MSGEEPMTVTEAFEVLKKAVWYPQPTRTQYALGVVHQAHFTDETRVEEARRQRDRWRAKATALKARLEAVSIGSQRELDEHAEWERAEIWRDKANRLAEALAAERARNVYPSLPRSDEGN